MRARPALSPGNYHTIWRIASHPMRARTAIGWISCQAIRPVLAAARVECATLGRVLTTGP